VESRHHKVVVTTMEIASLAIAHITMAMEIAMVVNTMKVESTNAIN
jgi:hypothetical protein